MTIQQTTRRGRHTRRGMAMVLVMIAMIIGVIAAVTFLAGQSTTHGISQNVDRHAKARMIAETGLATAIEYVNNSQTWRVDQAEGYWLPDQTYAGGSFQVLFEDEDGDLNDGDDHTCTIWAIGSFDGVTHTVSAIVTPTVPASINNLLLVVGNTSLSAEDSARAALARGWEYNVTVIDDGASAATYTSEFADNDVVWVSPTSDRSTLGTKLDNCTLGVVTTLGDAWQNLGLIGTATGTRSDTDIRITDNSQYITQDFPIGTLTIFTEDIDQAYSTATTGGGAQVLGANTAGSGTSLAVIDAGGALSDGSNAVGRRAFLPWADDSDFDTDKLNDNGLTILQRALEWAAAPPQGPPAVAHWMLDESTGTTVVDSRNGHNGEVLGGADWSLGQVIGAMAFDGYDDYVSVPSHDDFLTTDGLTITAWVKPESFGSGSDVDIILRKGEGTPVNWQFNVKNGKATLVLDGYDSGGTSGNTTLPLNEWSHVAASWDGSRIRIYVNGQIDNGSGTSYSATLGTDNRPIYIGGRSGSAGYDRFDGKIDDVRFYDYAVSGAELRVIYQEGEAASKTPRKIVEYNFDEVKPSPALAGHWKLDDSGTGGGGIAARDYFQVRDTARINSYNGALGNYSNDIAGSDAMVATNSTSSSYFSVDNSASVYGDVYCGASGSPSSVINAHIGAINGSRLAQSSNVSIMNASSPSGMPSSQGDRNINNAYAVNADLKFEDLTLSNGAVLTVSGHRTIQCTRTFTASGNAQIVIPDGSSLTIYAGRTITIGDDAVLNSDSSDPSKLTILGYSTSYSITIEDDAQVAAIVHSDLDLTIENDAVLYGSATARDDITLQDQAQVHLDINLPGLGIDDPPAVDETLTNAGNMRNGATGNQTGATADTGTSVDLDGSNDYIEVPHHDDYLLDSGAIAFWFRTADAGSDQGLFTKDASGNGSGGHLNISIYNNKVRAQLASSTLTYSMYSTSTLSNNTWYHVVMSFGPNGMALYLNGVEQDTDTYTGGMGTTSGGTGNTEPIGLGIDTSSSSSGSVSGAGNRLDGRMDDVRIYDYALDATQASELYNGSSLSESTLAASTVYDTASYGAALNLRIPDTGKITWVNGGGLSIDSATTISSEYVATKVADAVADTDEYSIEVKFAPNNVSQNGPARIVTLSEDNANRNFMIGQSSQRYTGRLRTTGTGDAGNSAMDSDTLLVADEFEHVIFSYDGETVTVYRDDNVDYTVDLTGALTGWDDYLLTLGSEADGSRTWLGTIEKISIFDRSLNNRQASNVFKGLDPGTGLATDIAVRWVEQP